jgi:hypothetical protein
VGDISGLVKHAGGVALLTIERGSSYEGAVWNDSSSEDDDSDEDEKQLEVGDVANQRTVDSAARITKLCSDAAVDVLLVAAVLPPVYRVRAAAAGITLIDGLKEKELEAAGRRMHQAVGGGGMRVVAAMGFGTAPDAICRIPYTRMEFGVNHVVLQGSSTGPTVLLHGPHPVALRAFREEVTRAAGVVVAAASRSGQTPVTVPCGSAFRQALERELRASATPSSSLVGAFADAVAQLDRRLLMCTSAGAPRAVDSVETWETVLLEAARVVGSLARVDGVVSATRLLGRNPPGHLDNR